MKNDEHISYGSSQPAASEEPDWAPNWNAMLAAARNAGWSFTKSEDGIVRMVPLVHGEAQVAAQPSVPEYPTRTGRAEGRLAGRPFQSGDVLPAPGSYCLVSGANCDIESDQHRGYSWRQVLGYSNDRQFICLQTNDCWPTVERTANCWFAEIPHPDGVAPTPPAVGQPISDVLSDVLSDVVTQGIGIMRIDPTDIYQSTPPAVEQPSAQGREDTERLYAIKEGVRNAACDNHFASRGHLDYNIQAAVFNAGFDRGWDAAIDAARKEQP